ncbi:MAG: S41 family peptidase [Alphaproteobacteria bacterium]|nr:S41 family peptidase [Alphaproteobacteria bacterium]
MPILLAACASQPDVDPDLSNRMHSMFRAVYIDVDSVHLSPLNMQQFTLAGLDGLRGIDPDFKAKTEGDDITLSVSGSEIRSERLLDPSDSPQDWADFATSLVLYAKASGAALGDAPEETYYEKFIDSALRTLDRFSRYATPKAAADLKAEREGFGGIGVVIESHPDGARIDQIEPDKPAAGAGLVSGDRIVAIDGTRITGMSLRQVERLLRGPIDTVVRLTIVRIGLPEPLAVTVGRTRIVPNTVFLQVIGDHALIRISSFNERTSKRISEAVSQARQEIGPALSGLIIDLRGNLGGLLDQAIDSSDLFLDEGLISRADGRHPESHQRFMAELGDIASGLPIVVLINGASASSAEILASALQDHGRAVLVGMNSFGKGSIQTVLDMPNGGELYVTWARFVAPSGYPLQRLGVMPTICTSGASDAVSALNTALSDGPNGARTLLMQRRTADINDETSVKRVLALCPWEPHASGDIDLSIAELLLDSPTLLRRALEIARVPDGA